MCVECVLPKESLFIFLETTTPMEINTGVPTYTHESTHSRPRPLDFVSSVLVSYRICSFRYGFGMTMYGATPHFYGADWDDVVQQAFEYYAMDDPNKLQFIVIERPKERRFRRGLWRVAVACPEYQAEQVKVAQRLAIEQGEKVEREKRKEEMLEAKKAELQAEMLRKAEEERKSRRYEYPPMTIGDYNSLAQDWGYDDWDRFDDSRP